MEGISRIQVLNHLLLVYNLFLYLRWLAGDEVLAVYPGISGPIGTADRSSAFVVTDVGVTHIRGELMSLNDKAMEIAKVYDSQGFTNSPFN